MCTAISSKGQYHLFGRTLDIECSYGEMVVTTPRNFKVDLIHESSLLSHFAIIGMACVRENTPLYYDAMNEAGLAMAGLNFPKSAVYYHPKPDKNNIASFELIAWVLCQCENLSSAIELLSKANITSDSFSPDLPTTSLHWIISDKQGSVTVESTAAGLEIYENRFEVLTNNPSFPYHATHISNFMQLDSEYPENNLCPSIKLYHYSRGMGAIGLPGDFSSSSRFVRAVFTKNHTVLAESEYEEISRFFHIMDSVSVPYGCVKTEEGKNVSTVYTSCANTDTLTYYFTTYSCRRIRAISLRDINTDCDSLTTFAIEGKEDILYLKP